MINKLLLISKGGLLIVFIIVVIVAIYTLLKDAIKNRDYTDIVIVIVFFVLMGLMLSQL